MRTLCRYSLLVLMATFSQKTEKVEFSYVYDSVVHVDDPDIKASAELISPLRTDPLEVHDRGRGSPHEEPPL